MPLVIRELLGTSAHPGPHKKRDPKHSKDKSVCGIISTYMNDGLLFWHILDSCLDEVLY